MNRIFFPNDAKLFHFKPLDGLRGIAVIIVILAHLSNGNPDINIFPFLDFQSLGKVGVLLFFMLSSYLLDRQIALALLKQKADLKYWLNYFLRRFLRIFPLYIFALLIYYAIRQNGYPYCICITSPQDFWNHLSFQSAKGVFWSIPVEFKYYFISPIIILVYKVVFNWRFSWIFISTSLLISFILYSHYINGFDIGSSTTSTFPYLPIFLLGSLYAVYEVLYSKQLENVSEYAKIGLEILAWFGFFAALILGGSHFFRLIIGQEHFWFFKFVRKNFIILGILLLFTLIGTKYGKGWFAKMLSLKPLRFIGVISFSLYIFHFPIVKIAKKTYFPVLDNQFAFVFTISILVSSLTYLFIEYPMAKFKLFAKDKLEKL